MSETFIQLSEELGEATRRFHIRREWGRTTKPGDWSVYWRDTDGFGQVLPRPAAEEVAAFYETENYYTHISYQESASNLPKRSSTYWRALQHLAWRFDNSVEADLGWWTKTLGSGSLSCLEIGCGNGNTLALLRGLGHQVVGVEPDPHARETSRAEGITVYSGTAEKLPRGLMAESFDVIIMIHVLEHCIDPVLALVNASKLLKPNGKLIVDVPNNACLGASIFGASWAWLDVPRHLNFFTPKSLEAILMASGYTIQLVEFWGYNRQFSSHWAAMQNEVSAEMGDPRGRQSWRYIALLASTILAPPERKYDSVRVVAGHAGAI